MATRYLNKTIKNEIENSIKYHVKSKMKKSIPGKELVALQKTLVDFLRKKITRQFTAEELVVLKKYNATRTENVIYVIEGKKGQLNCPWRHGSIDYFDLRFTPPLETPSTSQFYDYRYRELLQADEKMLALTRHGIKTFNHIDCEIKATTAAYMEIVDTFRTVAKLVKEYPDLETFIPEPEATPTPIVTKKAASIIKNFEAA